MILFLPCTVKGKTKFSTPCRSFARFRGARVPASAPTLLAVLRIRMKNPNRNLSRRERQLMHNVRRRIIKAGLFAVLSVFASLAVAAKTLVFCSEGSPEGFNPQFFETGTTMDASSVPIYNRLVQFDLGTTNIIPALAESWTVSADGLSYTFRLRKGVKFHSNAKFKPTRDFNADDVLFTYYRMADPKNPFHNTAPGQTFAYFEDMGLDKIVDKLEKIDDYTIRFKLKHPEAPFLADMAMDFASILSAEY
ncbi:MAG TPA: ABC transporter substrate-binding protein, partial [Acetobacteraceae bacterium]|nr:ABC transporter substrate-binding protein [Acetobacteraceae bacterium]